MIPGGGGNAAVVGESAIAKDYLMDARQGIVDLNYESKIREKAKLVLLLPLTLI